MQESCEEFPHMGVITGDMFVNGKALASSFQRQTGYVQQQDLHLETATVRESLRFSAMLRQPSTVSKEEKYRYVEVVFKILRMEEFADVVVGVPVQGLNVEQRKLLTIGVEIAAKSKLLLFLDEPTSGLDSQSSWVISKGGKTVYFGEIGQNSRTLLDYIESNGARQCDDQENPAEYMLEVVSQGTNSRGEEWPSVWKSSVEYQAMTAEIETIHREKAGEKAADASGPDAHLEFAMPFWIQLRTVMYRIAQQYWRMPTYVFAKWTLSIASGLFIGFSFYQPDSSQAGMQNVLFGVFMVTTIFSSLVQQIMPLFVTQRSLYEVRERPSKAYSWKAFVIANIMIEIPYQIMSGILLFACVCYPVAGIQESARQVLVLLFLIQFMIFSSSFAQMCIAALPDAETASAVVTLLTLMSITFCGVLQSPGALPGFWILMYRVSPFTYWIAGIVSTELHDRVVNCSNSETSIFSPPSGQTCGQYLRQYLSMAPGQLQNPDATADCRYCSLTNADQFLASSNIYWGERWRNFGLVWIFVFFNVFVAVLMYYLFRVAKWGKGASKTKSKE